MEDGADEGCCDNVGPADGTEVGASEGLEEGLCDTVGPADGTSDGC